MRPIAQLGCACSLAWTLLVAPTLAEAQTERPAVLVLGIRALDGDDDIALAATNGLRDSANEVQAWQVSERSMSLSQMMLAHGCEEPDDACLAQIAQGAQAQLVVYGSLRRTSDAYGPLELTVSSFDARTGATTETVSTTFPRTDGDGAGLQPHTSDLIAQLAPAPAAAAAPAPPPPPTPTPVATTPAVPTHTQVRTDDRGDGSHQWVAYALLGTAGAAVIGAITSAIVVNNIEDDALFIEYKDAVAAGNARAVRRGGDLYEDACVAADDGLPYGLSNADVEEVADMCVRGSTAEVLQWVFFATAVIAGSAGTYLLLSDEDEERDPRHAEPTLSLQPSFDAQSARLSATLRL